MVNFKKPEDRASETVTFRLTPAERQLLSEVAEAENKSLTNLIRFLVKQRAQQIGIEAVEVVQRPSRAPKPKRPSQLDQVPAAPHLAPSVPSFAEPYSPLTPDRIPPLEPAVAVTFGDLVVQFRESFSTRADGTRKELDDTIRFLGDERRGEALISFELPLTELTSEKLRQVRTHMLNAEIRVAKKNLHLTYLRMMLHWALKQENIELVLNPAVDLKPFTISEVPGGWTGQFFSSQSGPQR